MNKQKAITPRVIVTHTNRIVSSKRKYLSLELSTPWSDEIGRHGGRGIPHNLELLTYWLSGKWQKIPARVLIH
jgi:hypothetical protein